MRYILILILLASPSLFSRESADARIAELERQVSALERELRSESRGLGTRMDRLEDDATAGIGLLVSGIICALWAHYTRRSAWLWFFFGLLLAPIALIAMVWKNALGLESRRLRHWTDERF